MSDVESSPQFTGKILSIHIKPQAGRSKRFNREIVSSVEASQTRTNPNQIEIYRMRLDMVNKPQVSPSTPVRRGMSCRSP